MRKIFKRLVSAFLIPLTRWYLQKKRKYSYRGANVIVLPGVFHPGFFYSTKFLVDFLLSQSIQNKFLLELGCGTGLISVVAAKAGATVTASDLNQKAIENTILNAQRNQVLINTVHSDLFDNVEKRTFDWIIINPPYYQGAPKNEEELAWYCGENFDYFQKLFYSLGSYMDNVTQVIMVLTLGSELERIFAIGNKAGYQFELIGERAVLFDGKDFLYRIKSNTL
jgi:release factor glutamine methyltransferase